MRERLYLFDTTLRDGAQMNGVDFTLHDKLAIAKLLDGLGIDYIEGGYPGANPTDTELFGEKRDTAATFTEFFLFQIAVFDQAVRWISYHGFNAVRLGSAEPMETIAADQRRISKLIFRGLSRCSRGRRSPPVPRSF